MTASPGAGPDGPRAALPHAQPPPENRAYLAFIASALGFALAGGFLFAIVLPLSASGVIPWEERVPHLLQAHGWAQLQGWAGLFVAGMSTRLVPLFSGRPAIRARFTLPVLVLLVFSIMARSVVEPFAGGSTGDALLVAAGLSGGAGMLAVAAAIAGTLSRSRRPRDAWFYFAGAASAWWAAWAVLTAVAAIRAAGNDRLTPVLFDDTLTWIVIFGPIGNVIWVVQSRSVPVFFGRKPPAVPRVVVPGIMLNAGVLALAASLLPMGDSASQRVAGIGLLLAAVACLWLAPVAGASWGRATRLRPRSRAAARYVVAANLAAMAGGLLLAWAGLRSLAAGEFAAVGARDAARHAFGLGLVTMLALGMARLITPVFALERAEARPPSRLDQLSFWLLAAAIPLRIAVALLLDHMDSDLRLELAAVAGALGWASVALFAVSVARARYREPRMRALLADAAAQATSSPGDRS